MEGERQVEVVAGRIVRLHGDARAEVARLLRIAAELEHLLVIEYLYAGYSVRDAYFDRIVGDVRTGEGASQTLSQVAVEEMLHLRQVNQLLIELGAPPHLGRPKLPFRSALYPFDLQLEPLSSRSLARYLYIEAPPGVRLTEEERHRADAGWWSDERPPAGSVYRTVLGLLDELSAQGEDRAPRWKVTIESILHEGEQDHYAFLLHLFRESTPPFEREPGLETGPSRSLRRVDVDAESSPEIGAIARASNEAYWATLALLECAFQERHGRALAAISRSLMLDVLHPLGKALARSNRGVPFDVSPPDGESPMERAARHLIRAIALISAVDQPDVRKALDLARARLRSVQTAERRVVVVGAGPAGLAAAWALSNQGLEVVVVDRGRDVGGKVESAWVNGRSSEHGVHGWWNGYVNFDALLRGAGVSIEDALIPASGTGILSDQGELDFQANPSDWLPLPLYLLPYVWRPKLVSPWRLPSAAILMLHVFAFDHAESYAHYDATSFASLAEQLKVDAAVFKNLFAPFAHLFDYASPDEVSAASILSALQVYLLPSQRAVVPRWSHGSPHHAIFGPIRDALLQRGVAIRVSTEVTRVEADERGVLGVGLRSLSGGGGSSGGGPYQDVSIRDEEVPPEGSFAPVPGARLLVGRLQGKTVVYPATCPHQNGALEVADGQIRCKKHGARFGYDGTKLAGVGSSGLTAETYRVVNGSIVVSCAMAEDIPCAHVVVATDVRAAGSLLGRSSLPASANSLVDDVSKLRATSVLVVRLWFRHDTPTPKLQTVILPHGRMANVYFELNQIDGSYDVEGRVIELHSSDPGQTWSTLGDQAILDAAFEDLGRLARELTRDRLLSQDAYEIRRHGGVFTLYDPESDELRPRAETPVPGLHLAGDWTRADAAYWMMERAVVSGLRAANRVRDALGLAPATVLAPPDGGKPRAWARRLARVALRLRAKLRRT